MDRWELYGTWAILIIIGFGISSVSRQLSEVQKQIGEILRKLSRED
jgi:hypothetical protein